MSQKTDKKLKKGLKSRIIKLILESPSKQYTSSQIAKALRFKQPMKKKLIEKLLKEQTSFTFSKVNFKGAKIISGDKYYTDKAVALGAEKPKRKRRLKRDLFPRNLAVIVRDVLIPEEVQLDPDAYREIGEEHHDEISCTRSALFWERTTRKKFVTKEDRAASPVILPAPEPSVPGTMCSAAFMAKILADKYLDHLPHYRQAARIERRYGAQISRQTLNKWTHAAADFLSPIADAILAEILQSKVIQVDETPIEYLQPGAGATGKGYLWPVLDPMSGAVHYSWRLGRGHEQLVEILRLGKPGGFSGIIQCDGFSAYETLAKRYPDIGFCHLR